MEQGTNSTIEKNQNIRIMRNKVFFFFNRRKERICDSCGKHMAANKLKRGIARLTVNNMHHVFISYLCRRCS
jgi:hypothetical protein